MREQLKGWLRHLSERHNISAEQIANRCGISSTTITRFIKHDDAPMVSMSSLEKIEQGMGESFSAFLGSDDQARNDTERRALTLLRQAPADLEEKILDLLEAVGKSTRR